MTGKIHEFNPYIYPFRLWVGVRTPYEEAEKTFYKLATFSNEQEPFDKESYMADKFTTATCHPVIHKETGRIGIFCMIRKPKQFAVDVIAHESSHIADFVFELLGMENSGFNNGEPRAYLVGWCADCLDKVKRNKIE